MIGIQVRGRESCRGVVIGRVNDNTQPQYYFIGKTSVGVVVANPVFDSTGTAFSICFFNDILVAVETEKLERMSPQP